MHKVSSAFGRSELEGFTFLHRLAFHKIGAEDNARSGDLLYSGHRFVIWRVLRGKQVAFFEPHMMFP